MEQVTQVTGYEIPEDHVVYDVSHLSNPVVEASNHVSGVDCITVFEQGGKHYMVVHKDAQVTA